MGCCGCLLGFAQGEVSVCRNELDLACGSPWPLVRSLMGATTLLAWGMQDLLLAGEGGLPKLGVRSTVPLQRVGRGWGRAGAPSPF